MAGIQVLRIESRVTLDTSLARHIDGGSRPETARDVAVPVVELGGVGVEAGGAAIEAARPRGRGRPPHHAVELVLGGPPPYGSDEWPEEREREWAEACYEWAQGVLGSRSVIVSAAWHRDETSPHIHVLAVPIDSSEKLRWKGVRDEAADRLGVPRRGRKLAAAYRAFQDDFYESVSAGYGLGRGEVGSSARHVQIDRAVAAERRREVAEAGADEADARAADARKVMARREKLYEEAAEFDRRRVSASAAAVQKEAEHDELKRQVDRLCSVLAAAEARGGWMRRARAERELQAREAAADGREEAVTKREVMVDGREPDVEAREAAVADLAQRKSEADKARSAAHTAEGRSLSMARLARHRRQRVLDAIQDARDERELLAAAQAAAETVEANLEVRGRDLDTRAGELDERETGIEARAGARADELAVVRTRERSDGLDRRESGIEARAGARADELAVVRTRERSDGLDRREAGIEARAGARADELAVVCTRERSDGLDRREAGIEARAGARADELAVVRTRERSDGLDRREAGIEARAGVRADELATERTAVRDRELDEREGCLDKRENGIEVRAGVRADELATERTAVRDRELDEREGRLDKRESGIEVRAGVRADELATERTAVRDRELDEREGRLDKRESGIEVRAGVRADELATERMAVRDRELDEREGRLDKRESGIEVRAGVRADELATERMAVRDRELDEREGRLDKRESGIEVRAGVRADELATERTAAEKAREWATQEATSAGQLHAAVLAGRHDLVHTKAWRQVELLTDSAEEWVRDTWPDTDRGEDAVTSLRKAWELAARAPRPQALAERDRGRAIGDG